MGLNSTSPLAIAGPSPLTRGYTLHSLFRSYGDDYWKADPILSHRVRAGVIEYLVPWVDIDPATGQKYAPTWEPEAYVTPDMVTAYRKKAFSIKPVFTDGPIDITPLLFKVLKAIARAVTLGRTACRAHIHAIALDALSLWDLAVPLLNMLAAAVSTKDVKVTVEWTVQKGAATMTLKLKKMEQISYVTNFQEFIDVRKATGALNYDIGRDSNVDCIVVAPEMLFTVSQDMVQQGACSGKVQFPTAKVNGIYGTIDYPMMSKGMLKKQATRNAVLAYVKATLPDAHPLVRKGWRELPAGVATLSHEAATGSAPLKKRPVPKYAPKGGKKASAKRMRLSEVQEQHEVQVAESLSAPRES